ncbi:tetratricopeptide repeat-containing glycosyltransferase family protein [Paraburkholderia sediminicola]|uniref:tetratricopeptide repeat-containing glycosyltransferase family protein n=1 Tax=Paraburkholderia sediminicola TaxID=458836 RepID=UPI0038BA6AE9
MKTPSHASSDDVATLYDEALQAHNAGHFDTAATILNLILSQHPSHAESLHLGGLVTLASGQTEAASEWVERATEARPDPVFYNTLAVIQCRLRAFARSAQSASRGLALQPDLPVLHYNHALALQYQDRIEESAISYRRALELDPGNSAAHNNLGLISKALGALDEAERRFRCAIALAPDNLSARSNLGHTLLAAERYEEAWPFFEDRWASFEDSNGIPQAARPQLPLPQWKGESPEITDVEHRKSARNTRLLIIHEQGYGDSLQFVRYLPLALERFSQVAYVCPSSLQRLYERSFSSRWPGLVLIDALPEDLSDWDWYCPLMSLPMAFGTRFHNVPATIPYLFADADRAGEWRTRLIALPNPELPRIGIVWAGGHSGMDVDRLRSLSPAQIAPLLALPHVRWVSLQKTDDPTKRLGEASRGNLIDWTDELTDFADTAALLDNLDLVISVDTSVAHLAAAMGKRVWLLNRFAGCWRWARDRDDSPWYPSVRIFTQSRRGNWDDVLARVAVALQQRFLPHDARRGEERGLPHAGNQTP